MPLHAPLVGLSAAAAALTIAGITTNEDTTRKLVVIGGISSAVGAVAALQGDEAGPFDVGKLVFPPVLVPLQC